MLNRTIKNTKTSVVSALLITGVCLQGFASCTPDASTSRAVGIPSGLQSAISSLNAKLGGTIPLAGLSVTASSSIAPTISIIEEDCKDENNCTCGTYDTGSGSLTIATVLSATLSPQTVNLGPVGAWGYYVSSTVIVAYSLSGNAGGSGNLSVSRDCSGDWRYSSAGTLSGSTTVVGSGSASATLTSPSETNTYSCGLTAGLSDTVTGSYSLSESGVSGSYSGDVICGSITIDVPVYGPLSFDITL